MGKLALILLLLLLLTAAGAVAAPAQYAFRISFTDKQGAPSLSATPAWLSARSMARRANFGIALDSTDRPVSPLYIDTVLQLTNGVLHNTSRWLNHCVVLLEDSSQILQLSAKPYISSTEWVCTFANGLHQRIIQGENPKFAAERGGGLDNGKVAGSPDDYGSSWSQTTQVNGDFLHDQGFRGEGKLIAVIDAGFTGVDNHRSFTDLRAEGRILEVYNFKRNDTTVYAYETHGQECLALMASNEPGWHVGTAPKAQYALYVSEDGDFSDAYYELDNLIAAMERADSIGADVVSVSLDYLNFFDYPPVSFTKGELDGHTTIISRSVNMAGAKGILYVTGAGNFGYVAWNFLLAPADADSALTVGSVRRLGTVSPTSSPGPNSSGRVKPEICLRGDPATIFPGVSMIGTSYAAPQAAGYAACLMQAFPHATPYQIRQAIIQSADSFTAPSAKRGYGIPDFMKVFRTLSVGGPALNSSLPVFPNPFDQSVVVRLPAGAIHIEVSLLDALGRSIGIAARRDSDDLTVQVASPLPAGVYFLHAVVDGRRYTSRLTHGF